jgi:hypothetical protein
MSIFYEAGFENDSNMACFDEIIHCMESLREIRVPIFICLGKCIPAISISKLKGPL